MMKSKRDINEDKYIFTRIGTLNSVEFICCILNSIIGSGALRLGSSFNSGIIFSHILNIFVALVSIYSVRLFVYAAAYYHESTFEEIWSVAFSNKTKIIPAICSVLSSFTNVMSYLSFLQNSFVQILSMLILLINEEAQETVDQIERYSLLIGLGIIVIFCVPICMSSNLRLVAVLSFISLFFFGGVFIYIIARFIEKVCKDGFDPNHRLKLFDIKDNISTSISSLTYAYLFYPFAWPGLRHSRKPTVKNLLNAFNITILITFIIYTIMGTFSYLTFFDENTGGVILDYYPSNTKTNQVLMLVSHIFVFIYIMFTIPVVLNPSRYIILNYINKKDEFPLEIWSLIGITLSLISLLLANFPDNITDIIYNIADILTLSLLFIFPPILYLKGYGKSNKLHLVGAIFEIILGAAVISFMLYLDLC